MKLENVIPALELEKTKKQKGCAGKIIPIILKWMEKYFGATIMIRIPFGLQKVEMNLWDALETAEKLQELGIIKKIQEQKKYSDEPFLYIFFSQLAPFISGTGADFLSPQEAIWKAIGETTERYLWYSSDLFFKDKILQASYNQIKSKALDIFKLAGFSKKQIAINPVLQFNENTVFGWMPAKSLSPFQDKKTWCPIQLVSRYYFGIKTNIPYNKKESKKEPMLRWCVTTGLATGKEIRETIVKGILEIIEREAYITTYLNKISPPILDLECLAEQDEDLEKIFKTFKRYNLEVHLLNLPTDFPVNVISAVIIDRSGLGPAFSLGNSADFNFKNAILSSLTEALITRYSLKKKFKDRIKQSKETMRRLERTIYWSKSENLPKITFLIEGEKIKVDLVRQREFFNIRKKTDRKKYYESKFDFLMKELQNKNMEACYVELSDKRIKKLGLRCTKVVIPEMQPMHLDEIIPYFGGERLKSVPEKLNYKPAAELNQEPHPFC